MKNFSEKVTLGRTGLSVSRLGIGSAYWVSEKACRRAFDAGINYFFWGSIRTPGMALAVQEIAKNHRQDLIEVLECYARHPWMIRKSVEQGLRKLKIDQADILLLGWHDEQPSMKVLDTVRNLKEKGRYRFLGISSHIRTLFPGYIRDDIYDVFHIRYNAAHTGAEKDIFPLIPEVNPPGITSFTATRWGQLTNPKKMPPGETPLTAADCYRFALSSGFVDVCLTGPKNEEELDGGMKALELGPLSDEEMERVRRIGRYVYGK